MLNTDKNLCLRCEVTAEVMVLTSWYSFALPQLERQQADPPLISTLQGSHWSHLIRAFAPVFSTSKAMYNGWFPNIQMVKFYPLLSKTALSHTGGAFWYYLYYLGVFYCCSYLYVLSNMNTDELWQFICAPTQYKNVNLFD